MPLRLVDDDLDLSLDIPTSTSTREALRIQMERCLDPAARTPFPKLLVLSLLKILDADLQPPTRSQICYADSIAKALSMSLPREVLRFRGSMHEFLSYHAPIFNEHRERQARPTHVQNDSTNGEE